METLESTSPNRLPTIAEDYYALREEGIRLLQAMSSDTWTDHNIHDPGITILEQLCYALTDLAYRIGHPISDLLSHQTNTAYAPELYRARNILSSGPVTLDDYRKIILAIDGVRNAWVEKVSPKPLILGPQNEYSLAAIGSKFDIGTQLKGMLAVKIEPDLSVPLDELQAKVIAQLMANRNLGEDFIQFDILEPEPIRIEASIEVEDLISTTDLLVEIYKQLSEFISPKSKFYTLNEMLEKGHSVDEIMEGPRLSKGYLDPNEFSHFSKKQYIRGSDLINVISSIKGVRFVRDLTIVVEGEKGNKSDSWSVTLDVSRFPLLQIPDDEHIPIRLMRGEFELDIKSFNKKWEDSKLNSKHVEFSDQQVDILPKPGRYRSPGEYQSIQHQFPLIYGLGHGGVTEDASLSIKARVKQLKAYLLFFDQLLFNAFSQLEDFKNLISLNQNELFEGIGSSNSIKRLPLDVPSIQDLLTDDMSNVDEYLFKLKHGENEDTEDKQLHRVANHLLARVGEQISDFGLLGKTSENSRNQALALKKLFLSQYEQISLHRAGGINYTQDTKDVIYPVSALQQRLSVLLGIPEANKAPERFWLVEHHLLRPLMSDLNQFSRKFPPGRKDGRDLAYYLHQPEKADLFSLQISFVFPGFVDRFQNNGFRTFVERLIRAETPVHIKVYVIWMNQDEFERFEPAYLGWQRQQKNVGLPMAIEDSMEHKNELLRLRIARNQVIDTLALERTPFGHTHPILNLPVTTKDDDAEGEKSRISEGEKIHVRIAFSQTDVSYRLWNRSKKAWSGEALTGNGQEQAIELVSEPLVIEEKLLGENLGMKFDIVAIKPLFGTNKILESCLQKTIDVEIRLLQWDLDVRIAKGKTIKENTALDSFVELDFKGEATIRIPKAQPGVIYTLYTAPLVDSDFEHSHPEGKDFGYRIKKSSLLREDARIYTLQTEWTGKRSEESEWVDISIPKNKLTEDTLIKLSASYGGDNPLLEFLDQRVCVFVGPDPKVKAIPGSTAGQIEIASPETGVSYTLLLPDGSPNSSATWIAEKVPAGEDPDPNKHMRVEVDYVLNAQTSKPLILSHPAVSAETIFTIQARRLNTGITTLLTSTITVNV